MINLEVYPKNWCLTLIRLEFLRAAFLMGGQFNLYLYDL